MRKPAVPPKRIAVAPHPSLPEATQEASEVAAYLRDLGCTGVTCASLYDSDLRQNITAGAFDLLIALGGDGTMLRAGHLCAAMNLPVLGINLGHFGFLIEVQRSQWRATLPQILDGHYWIEDRMMLVAEHWRGEARLGSWEVLNEVVVCRGRVVRPIHLKAYVDSSLLTTFVADGLIASTATGSTAYSLAAGGPIMPPELRNILLMPVAPHLSMDRAIILPEGASVRIAVHTNHEAVASVDGHPPVTLLDDDEVRVQAGEHMASFVRLQDPGYFYRNLTMYMEQNPSAGNI
jgi:NAD+ kinase